MTTRLARAGRLVLYGKAKQLLAQIIDRDRIAVGGDPSPENAQIGAEAVLFQLDGTWRLVERESALEMRQRQDPDWLLFRAALAEHERRAGAVFERYLRRKRDLGAAEAARLAAHGWVARLPHRHRHRRAAVPPLVWESRIARALVDTLEQLLDRRLRLGGPDVRLLVELFEVVIRDRTRRHLPVRLKRGKGSRNPGSPTWFEHILRYRRAPGNSL
jgi:hypothetical protein